MFKALALGAPYIKSVCMGRALMIPGMVDKNIKTWIKANDLPITRRELMSLTEECAKVTGIPYLM